MRTLIFAAALALVAGSAQAQTNCHVVRNSIFCDDGSSAHAFGNSITVNPAPAYPIYPWVGRQDSWRGDLMGAATALEMQRRQMGAQRSTPPAYTPPSGQACGRGPDGYPVCGPTASYIPPRCTKTGYVYSCD